MLARFFDFTKVQQKPLSRRLREAKLADENPCNGPPFWAQRARSEIYAQDDGKPPFAGCGLGRRAARRTIPAEPAVGVAGPGWHRSAFASDSAMGLGPAFPSHGRSTCGNARRLLSAWFLRLAESDTKADPCQKWGVLLRNRTLRPIRARFGKRDVPFCSILSVPDTISPKNGRNLELYVHYTCGQETVQSAASDLPAETRDRSYADSYIHSR